MPIPARVLLTPEPPPKPHNGDVVRTMVEAGCIPAELVEVFLLRRQQGLDKYGTPLGPDGRNGGADLGQELVDACIYSYRLVLYAKTLRGRAFGREVLTHTLALLQVLVSDFDKDDFTDDV